MKRFLFACAMLALILWASGPFVPAARATAPVPYTIVDLGTLGGTYSYANAINDAGWVVGQAGTTGDAEQHGFLFAGSQPLIDLQGGSYSIGSAINATGAVAGLFTFQEPYTDHAFFYDGTLQDLGTLTNSNIDGSRSRAWGINASGVVVGTSDVVGVGTPYHAFRWTGSGPLIDLGVPSGFANSEASGVNDATPPTIVGDVFSAAGSQAALYHVATGSWQVLGLFPNGGTRSSGHAINDAGVAVGSGTVLVNGVLRTRAFRSVNGGPLEQLGVLPGDTQSAALAVNDLGQIVGVSYGGVDDHPFLWHAGQMIGLNDVLPAGSGWVLLDALGINNAGQIVGAGLNPDGDYRAYLLSPSTATTTGTDVVVQPIDELSNTAPVTLTFSNITTAGTTTLTISSTEPGPTPSGFTVGDPPTYYEISTTALFAGLVTVCIDYTGITLSGAPTLHHFVNGAWENVTTAAGGVNIICGDVNSLSPFAVFGAATHNEAPTVDAAGPYTVAEGDAVVISAVGNDPEDGALAYEWDLDANGSFETPGASVSFSAAALDGPLSATIAVRVTDPGGLTGTSATTVSILNVAPSVGAISAPASPILIGANVSVSASFSDPAAGDTHQAAWNWGDGNSDQGTVGVGSVTGSHVYSEPGVKTIVLSVTDDNGDSGTSSVQRTIAYKVCLLYEPERGVTSGATIAIKVQLCDHAGANLSSSGIPLTVQGVSMSPNGPFTGASAGDIFRYDASLGGTGGYIYNLSTRTLERGRYVLGFTVGPEPYVYAAGFRIK